MTRPSVTMASTRPIKCVENFLKVGKYMACISILSIVKSRQFIFSNVLVCGVKSHGGRYHGKPPLTLHDVQKVSDRSSGVHDLKVTCTARRTGTSFPTVGGATPPLLHLVIWKTTIYFIWNVGLLKRSCWKCGERSWNVNKMCGIRFIITSAGRRMLMVWR